MGLVMLDGFDDLSSWGGGTIVGSGRYGTGLRLTTGNSCTYPIHAAQESDTITMGFAWRWASTLGGGGDIVGFRRGGNSTREMAVNFGSDGSLNLTVAMYSGGGSSAAGVVGVANRWYYIEVQAKLAQPGGFITVRVDGAQVVTYSGNTCNTAGTFPIDEFYFSNGYGGTPYIEFDDVYLMTGVGDSFLGSLTVETLLPNGNGAASQWIGSDGNSTDNYLLVDEPGQPVISDYTYSSTLGHRDLYTLADLVHTTGNIVAVCHSAHMIATDAVTPVNVKLLNRRSLDTKGDTLALGTAYRSYEYCLTQDPEQPGYGTAQRPTVNGAPSSVAGLPENGARYRFARAGRVIGCRYYRYSGAATTLTIKAWKDSTSVKVAEIADTQAAVGGRFTVTFPTPVMVAANETWTFVTATSGNNSRYADVTTVTNTTDVTFIEMRISNTLDVYPGTVQAAFSYFVEPIYEPEVAGGPWTIANVNALQSGVELA